MGKYPFPLLFYVIKDNIFALSKHLFMKKIINYVADPCNESFVAQLFLGCAILAGFIAALIF